MGLFNWLSPKRGRAEYRDEEILRIYASGDRMNIRVMENTLYQHTFAYLPHSKKTVERLPDADDRRLAYSDAFLDFSMQMRLGLFRGDASVKTFFTSIFDHKVLDMLKRKRTHKYKANQPGAVELEQRLEVLSPKSRDILEGLLTKEKLEQVKAVLKTLYAGKTPCKELLLLSSAGIRQSEIADYLGLTTGSVKTKISDCRKQLSAKFDTK